MNPELAVPETEPATDEETDLRVLELPGATGPPRIGLPADADEPEVAAIVAAIASHIAAEGDEADDATDLVDPWTLCGRLGLRVPTRLPADTPRGDEWKIAGRQVGR